MDQPGETSQLTSLHSAVIIIEYTPIVIIFTNITSFYGEVVNEIK